MVTETLNFDVQGAEWLCFRRQTGKNVDFLRRSFVR